MEVGHMNVEVSKDKVFTSLLWKLLERSGTQGIQFVVQIILARLLLPSDYGMIALVMIFILLANVLIQKGFNTSLVQKKDADEVDFSSVLYLSLIVSCLLIMLLFFLSPYVASFYREPRLVLVLRVLSLTLFFGAFNSIQNAYVIKHMMFKKLFFSSLGSIFISGLVGIVAALAGLGVWALVFQQLTNQLMITCILWFTVKWRPRLVFSLKAIQSLFSFGWKLLASSLLNELYVNLRTLIIGRVFSPTMLGFYNRGQQFPQFIVTNIDGSIQAVMLPTLSAHQDDIIRVREMVRRSIVTSSFIMFPMMVGLAVIAEPLVKLLLTEKWLPAVPFLQLFCVQYAIMPIHTANLQAINALGRSDIFLKLEVIKKFVGVTVILVTLPYGIYALALGSVVGDLFGSFINAYPNKKLLNYSYLDQLKDILPSILLSFGMGFIVYMVRVIALPSGLILLMQIIIGILFYIGFAHAIKLESFYYLKATIFGLIKNRKRKEAL